jgi:hypothetical protein
MLLLIFNLILWGCIFYMLLDMWKIRRERKEIEEAQAEGHILACIVLEEYQKKLWDEFRELLREFDFSDFWSRYYDFNVTNSNIAEKIKDMRACLGRHEEREKYKEEERKKLRIEERKQRRAYMANLGAYGHKPKILVEE